MIATEAAIKAAIAEVTLDRVIAMEDLCDMGIPIKDVMPMNDGGDLRFLVGDLEPRYPRS